MRIGPFGALLVLASLTVAGVAFSQSQENSKEAQVVQEGQRPKFATLPPRYLDNLLLAPASATVTNWSDSFTSGGVSYPFTMVGTNPATTNTTTTINVYIIPIKMVCRGETYDPETVLANGQTPVTNTTSSPIFNSGVTFIQGGTNVGGPNISTPSSAPPSGVMW